MKTEPPEQTARRIGIIIRNGGRDFDFTDGVFKFVVDAGDGHVHYNYRCG